MFACLLLSSPPGRRPSAAEHSTAQRALVALAREFSPRIEARADGAVILDTTGLQSLFGDEQAMGQALRRAAADRALCLRVAVASSRTAARLVAQARAGVTVVAPGEETAVLASLPLSTLEALSDREPSERRRRAVRGDSILQTLRRWGLRTLGDLTALPTATLFERLGAEAVTWQRRARGDDLHPLTPALEAERFEASLTLEWPVAGLEPLSFVLARMLEPLCLRLERAGAGAAILHVRLWLVTRQWHERLLQLPAAIRDARVLRTLLLLDLESHPPPEGIDRIIILIEPAPTRSVQHSLLERALPSPEHLSTLLARLSALMGAGRCGAPALVDSHRPGAFVMTPFAPAREPGAGGGARRSEGGRAGESPRVPRATLRRFRRPLSALVSVESGRPRHVTITRRGGGTGGRVVQSAGPWRSSGAWWSAAVLRDSRAPASQVDRYAPSRDGETAAPSIARGQAPWSRDEWDVALSDGGVYRIFHDRARDRWFVEGLVD